MPVGNRSSQPEAVVSVECNEKHGKIIRHVYPLTFTKENLEKFYEKSKKYRTLFWEETDGDYERFLQLLLRQNGNGQLVPSGLFWYIDDFVGVFFLTNIVVGTDATVHYTFFDGEHNRVELAKAMLEYVFKTLQFRRLSAEVPTFTKPYVRNFVRSIGFQGEGMKRKCIEHKKDWFDVIMYGILKEEVIT